MDLSEGRRSYTTSRGTTAAACVLSPDAALAELVRRRTAQARTLMTTYQLRGVPALIAEVDGTRSALDASTLYSGPDAVRAALKLR
ncbi:hypothetical protein Q4543_23950 [Salipiger sp. 1_MG-2023]|uniref:hypothetical protein n=1 Tax=Salipiger sp. 1_MG-2023 TaxID=3062665 RepID=UPI0026E2F198|nr:hypothetical protein [Salipiger sp. 1_MG-2023]MDO6588525.1 hypothetical protein [Salipiger sp. 1_MG-2023]